MEQKALPFTDAKAILATRKYNILLQFRPKFLLQFVKAIQEEI
jgi:hypothetical protein